MPKFNNTPNEEVALKGGGTVWVSRSVAVVSNIWYISDDEGARVLLVRRSSNSAEGKGMWVLPGGYLDWGETLSDGAAREVFEESGVDTKSIMSDASYDILWSSFRHPLDQPYFINSDPNSSGNQVVAAFFGLVFYGYGEPGIERTDHQGEIDDVRWVPYQDISSLDIAFNHDKRIEAFYRDYVVKSIASRESDPALQGLWSE